MKCPPAYKEMGTWALRPGQGQDPLKGSLSPVRPGLGERTARTARGHLWAHRAHEGEGPFRSSGRWHKSQGGCPNGGDEIGALGESSFGPTRYEAAGDTIR